MLKKNIDATEALMGLLLLLPGSEMYITMTIPILTRLSMPWHAKLCWPACKYLIKT